MSLAEKTACFHVNVYKNKVFPPLSYFLKGEKLVNPLLTP